MLYHAVLTKGVRPLHKVLPHEELGEGERGQGNFVYDLHSRHVPDRLTHGGQQSEDVDTAFVDGNGPENWGSRRSKSRSRNCSRVALKRGSSSWNRRREARRRALPLELDRNEKERSPIAPRVFGLLLPAQESDSEEQGVRATLGEVVLDLPVELDQPLLQFLGGQLRGQLVPLQGFRGKAALQILAADFPEESLVPFAEGFCSGREISLIVAPDASLSSR